MRLDEDFSQANDLAATYPDKLKTLQAKFVEEAEKYDVFPLEPFEVGRDSIAAVDPGYKDRGEFPFTGTINKVEFQLK